MTPNYEDGQTRPPRKTGMPGWGWALIGCAVIAPVLLLFMAAILFPVFAQAREKARQTSCLSNCKQMSLAVMMYTQDYDGLMPQKDAPWMGLATPYIKNPDVFNCPSAPARLYGYAMNPQPLGKKWEKIPEPEKLSLIYDSVSSESNLLAEPSKIAYRHVRFANVAFADGHAKAVKRPGID